MAWKRASDLPARLRAVREALGLTQEGFAELAGVTDQSISDYENDRSRPSRSRLERLAKQLGIPVAVFGEGGPDPRMAVEASRRPQETRSPRRVTLEAVVARLTFLHDQMESYKKLGASPSPHVLEEWLRLTADADEALRPRPDPPAPPLNGEGPPAPPARR